MRVIERGVDRTAFAHITVEGRVNPLQEYGQYVDAHDKALCCYVAVEEGYKLRVKGSFSGPTLVVAYDCIVDGVCRKANSYVGKAVQVQKKKLDVDSFLYQTADGVIDTEMSVVPYTGTTNLDKGACETIGTIELRVSITRQFDVEHDIDDACKYDKVQEESDPSACVANYKDVPPQYQMTFEKNCSTLEGRKGNAERKKVHAKRPGKEPWAIFRFHYRTKESIETSKMDMTYNPAETSAAKQEPHPLELEFVPPLALSSKPAGKNDGDSSMRTSSPAPTDPPSTPTKGAKKSKSAQPKVVVPRKPQTKPDTITTNSTSEMAPSTDTEPTTGVEAPVVPKDLLEHLQSTPTKTKFDAAGTKTADHKKSGDDTTTSKKDGGDDLSASTPKKTPKKLANKAIDATKADQVKPSKEVVKKIVKKADEKKDAELADTTTSTVPMEVSNTPNVPHPADLPSVFDTPAAASTTVTPTIIAPNSKDFVRSNGKGFQSPLKKAAAKPAPVDTTTSTVLQKPVVLPMPATPLKRAPEGTLTPPPDLKRIKSDAVPPLTPTQLTRSAASSPSHRSQSIEAQVAEQRKRLEDARKKRAEMAKKKAAVDEKLAPYKQRMAEELERLRQEMAEEEAMMAAEEEDFMASEAMLAELEQGDDGF